ncbi:uncharacterized protein LOC110862130 [Folsomia candida]|uniref:Uncharacterized protein n=1 Tax=Folsomia candida TaxID=158441 RepID=A0A226D131_FOLCA|nr:uncharacterized protein LOC110862130 [Folsomia candida]OXA37996.1 hypothetical protein Fcan01_27222 [Folsomia candida]
MSKFLVVLGLVALLGQASFAALFSKPEALEDIEWTKAINAKLCEAGTHPDSVAKDFYACYDEKIVPGAEAFIKCQKDVYKVQMDSEKNVDTVCNAGPLAFPLYAGCLVTNLLADGKLPSTSMHKLNECQGKVMGVSAPQ